jgi:integrase
VHRGNEIEPGFGFHDLRLDATGLVMEGVEINTAQSRLGHSDARLTLAVYAQTSTEADRAAANRLGARFMSPPVPRARDGRAMERVRPSGPTSRYLGAV